jgi:GGDEF domain-containing protein
MRKSPVILAKKYRIIRKDGTIGWVHSYNGNFFSEDGTMQMAQGLIIDVTEQKELELKLTQANLTISEQNRKLEGLALTDPHRTFKQEICTISDEKSPEEIIKNADTALYNAKAGGRNRICLSRRNLS